MPVCCEGCNTNFTLTGYGRHLQQTTNPACVEIYAKDVDNFLPIGTDEDSDDSSDSGSGEDDIEEHEEDGMDIDDDGGPVPFQGDYFGNDYAEGDFEWFEEDSGDPEEGVRVGEDSESDGAQGNLINVYNIKLYSLLDEEDAHDHLGWEPLPRPPPLPTSTVDDHVSVEPGLSAAELRDAEEGLRAVEAVTEFPVPTAGKIWGRTADAGYHAYAHKLASPTSPSSSSTAPGSDIRNPWAPFRHHMDWEIARWAKLRGRGSSAFTDLLRIDGVSKRLLCLFPNADGIVEAV